MPLIDTPKIKLWGLHTSLPTLTDIIYTIPLTYTEAINRLQYNNIYICC